MDSHVHVGEVRGFPLLTDADPALSPIRDAYTRQQPRSYLYYGVTQVLNLLGSPESATAFEAQPQHPDLYRCGAAVVLDGYPSLFIEDKAVRYRAMPDYIYEPANAAKHPLPAGADAAQHTPEVIIGKLADERRSRCIKIFIEDGFGGASDWPLMSRRDIAAGACRDSQARLAADRSCQRHRHAAHRRRRRKSTCSPMACGTGTNIPPIRACRLLIATHRVRSTQKKIGYQPTLRVIAGLADLFREDTLKDPACTKDRAARLACSGIRHRQGQWFKEADAQGHGRPVGHEGHAQLSWS